MKQESLFRHTLEVSSFKGEGYLPLIDFESWRVAELRYIDELEPDKIDNMQKHNETDEVLWCFREILHCFLEVTVRKLARLKPSNWSR